MTNAEFKAALKRLGITQRAFAAMLSEHSPTAETTVYRWATGAYPVPAAVALAVTLLERIAALKDVVSRS